MKDAVIVTVKKHYEDGRMSKFLGTVVVPCRSVDFPLSLRYSLDGIERLIKEGGMENAIEVTPTYE